MAGLHDIVDKQYNIGNIIDVFFNIKTDRQRERDERDWEGQKQTEKQTQRQHHTHIYTQTYKQTDRKREREREQACSKAIRGQFEIYIERDRFRYKGMDTM